MSVEQFNALVPEDPDSFESKIKDLDTSRAAFYFQASQFSKLPIRKRAAAFDAAGRNFFDSFSGAVLTASNLDEESEAARRILIINLLIEDDTLRVQTFNDIAKKQVLEALTTDNVKRLRAGAAKEDDDGEFDMEAWTKFVLERFDSLLGSEKEDFIQALRGERKSLGKRAADMTTIAGGVALGIYISRKFEDK